LEAAIAGDDFFGSSNGIQPEKGCFGLIGPGGMGQQMKGGRYILEGKAIINQ
jgi:hypothetical protein